LMRALAFNAPTADLGGTELYGPLEAILHAPVGKRGSVRNIVLLTDGQVSNEGAVMELARKHRAQNRIFSFGIGHACSAHLVRGLARATGGAAEFITPGERIEEKVLRTFARLASPVMSDVRVDWGNADVQTLAELPPVFDGDAVVVIGRCGGKLPERVRLCGELSSGKCEWVAGSRILLRGEEPSPCPLPEYRERGSAGRGAQAQGMLATLWARRVIRSLEEVNGLARGAYRKEKSREADEVVRISKQFNVVSALTTFVAVEHRSVEERTNGMPEMRRVPIMLTQGWGGTRASVAAPRVAAVCARPAGAARRRSSRRMGAMSFDSDFSFQMDDLMLAPVAPASGGNLFDVLSTQTAEGSFAVPGALLTMLSDANLTGAPWEEAVERHARSKSADVISTVAVLVLLRSRFAAEHRTWKRHAEKAMKWVSAKLQIPTSEVRKVVEKLEREVLAGG
ncbi:MAG TPA: hypothetical protein VF669_06135, partial [Tepidisphaeraceae bacterium]